MPWIGALDILLAVSVLLYPCRAVLLWMIFWAVWTALLRPLAGEGIWEFLDRAGNYGVPLAFWAFSSQNNPSIGWWTKIKEQKMASATVERLILILKISTGLLLIGHGGFGALQSKEILIHHYASVGISLTKPGLAFIGWFEILLGCGVMLKPFRALLIFIILWKMGTELLYPLSGAPIWEWIERFSSYGAPLALFFLLDEKIERGMSFKTLYPR